MPRTRLPRGAQPCLPPGSERMPTPQPEENPLRRGLVEDRTSDACAVVIFGASGDLTRRKLMPALYNLAVQPLAARRLRGGRRRAAREDATTQFRAEMKEAVAHVLAPQAHRRGRVEPTSSAASATCAAPFERPGDLREAARAPRAARRGARAPRRTGSSTSPCRRPSSAPSSRACARPSSSRPRGRAQAGGPWTRVVFEKPFGHDLAERARAERHDRRGASTSRRSSASTTTSARRRCRTSSSSASPTASSSRSGAASTSTTCRSPSPRTSASRGAASSTSRPASRATSSRTT